MIDVWIFPLTKLQREVLIEIVKFMRTKRYSPTSCEISSSLSNVSASMVRHVINALVKKGYLTKIKGCHRSIALAKIIFKLSTRQIKRLPTLIH